MKSPEWSQQMIRIYEHINEAKILIIWQVNSRGANGVFDAIPF